MSQPVNHSKEDLPLKSAAVTDRGLSPKRPLNEDSFLADSDRGIFAVADGVGGAEAGEVASQTAIEVLDEAFRHQLEGADIEDLMELAIQRANASIYQMAQEHAKFSMMATTIVALHLKGNVANIGHVGDSRLYRLTPAGQLIRETADHSVVEEEVRAGRMTEEQAANHPSKNVISRALGAESDVEVDMKVIEVDDGTQFLLCTDGITRHIPDHELRQVLLAYDVLTDACAELKRRCFDRGAEDNLTAVLISVGTAISAAARAEDLDKTISPETTRVPVLSAAQAPVEDTTASFVPPSRKAFPAVLAADADSGVDTPLNIGTPTQSRGGVERTMTRLFLLVLFVCALAGAFYAGRRYRGQIPYIDQGQLAVAEMSPSPAEDPLLNFERMRRDVDADPNAWLGNGLKTELTRQGIQNPLDSADPAFLYLYGRASLLTGKNEEAAKAFEAAIAKADLNPSAANATLRREATLGLSAVALKLDSARPAALTRLDEISRTTSSPSISPAGSPSAAPGSPSSSP
ncbi:MAG: protein phosphatase 2C domain-containing protein [Acidobacteriota bacterium]|nr:protein phosphatase 2C domain-containing protein [Acidobacteriota bacterium]